MDERGGEPLVTEKRDTERLQTLYVVNDMLKQVVAEGLDIDSVLPRVLKVALQELDAPAGSIIVIDEHLQPRYAWIVEGGELQEFEDPVRNRIIEGGLFAWSTRRQRTALVMNTLEDDRWLRRPDHPSGQEPWSAICAPFIIRSRSVGAITVTRPGVGQFDQGSIDLLNAIANQAASTIESARLYRESQRRAGALAALVSATAEVSGSLDLDQVVEGVARQMARLVDVDACALFDWDETRALLTRSTLYAATSATEKLEISSSIEADGLPILRTVPHTLTPQQLQRDQLDAQSAERRFLVTTGAQAMLLVPMVAHESLVGIAALLSTDEQRHFANHEINLAQMLANQAAIAMENARMYEDTQRQLKVSALLNDASKVINSTLDTNAILQSLLAQMNELLNAEAISIALVDRQENELVYEVAEGIGSDKILGLRLPSNQGVSGWVMEHGEAALVNDTSQDPRFYRQADKRTGHDTRAMICAPLQVKGEVLGTIQAINPRQGLFSEADLQLLVNLANLASSALANAQQYARTQAAEARYLSLFEDSVNPILLTDLEGIIVEANRRAMEFLGYERGELIGLPIALLHPQGDGEQALPNLEKIGADRVQRFTTEIINEQQETVPVEGYAKQTLSGESDVLQWIYRDISQQVELEEMREDLMAMLVHDLQSPLGNVISSLELMRYELPADVDPVLESIVDIAARSSRRLQTLIRSLLDITRLEAGHPVSDAHFVAVDALLDDAREIVQPALARRRTDLLVDIPPDIPKVYVDADMLGRVMINLLDNASKYTPDTKVVTVRAEYLQEEEQVKMSVSDQGPGIPPKYREAIFDKFRRIQGEDAPKGMGLGLAFCRLAVQAHGGQIWVDSAPGGGARFNFTLPTASFQTGAEES